MNAESWPTESGAELLNAVYEGEGFRFWYPGFWSLQEEPSEAGMLVTLHASDTSFWCLAVFPDRPPVRSVVDQAVSTFQEEYPDAEVQESEGAFGPFRCLVRELEFPCHDLWNGVVMRGFRTGRATFLEWYQGYDAELEPLVPVFDAIHDSLVCDNGDDLVLDD